MGRAGRASDPRGSRQDRQGKPKTDLLMWPFLLAADHKIWLRFSLRALSIIFWDG